MQIFAFHILGMPDQEPAAIYAFYIIQNHFLTITDVKAEPFPYLFQDPEC